jgi:CHAD domain-containing protein
MAAQPMIEANVWLRSPQSGAGSSTERHPAPAPSRAAEFRAPDALLNPFIEADVPSPQDRDRPMSASPEVMPQSVPPSLHPPSLEPPPPEAGPAAGPADPVRAVADAAADEPPASAPADIVAAAHAGEPARWSRASRLDLDAGMGAGEAFAAIVRHSLAHFAANEDCARHDLHPEGVHQCRIALRRLRAAVQIYAPLLERERANAVRAELRWLAGVLGVARDLDVVAAELVAPAITGLARSAPEDALLADVKSKQRIAYAAVAQALGSARHHDLVKQMTALARNGCADTCADAGVDRALMGFAAQALSRAYGKLLRTGGGFELLSADERHDVRIALKRLRYALDFFVNLFDGRSKKKFMRRIARLQDDLGCMNDLSVTRDTLGRLVETSGRGDEGPASAQSLAFAAGGIVGRHQAGAIEAERRLVKHWYALLAVKPFWLGHLG